MHKKEFRILTIKHGNKLEIENEAEGHGTSASVSCLSVFHIYCSKSKILFHACVDEGCPVRNKLKIHLRGLKTVLAVTELPKRSIAFLVGKFDAVSKKQFRV